MAAILPRGGWVNSDSMGPEIALIANFLLFHILMPYNVIL